ncbi:DUF4112 domain-containing protein [Nitratireductor sp. GCM10026969]|uniref:DUF4112 domain-containing protein n=1 Tax=Nitratireductor sp. GCM10026969 TaxID=3252645 RepID=UPI003606F7AB
MIRLETDLHSKSEDERLAEMERLAGLLDSRWRIPGTPIRFGIDAVAGLIPGIGDAATGIVSAYLLYRAARMGVPRTTLAAMGGNVLLDVVFGAIPLLGSVFDVFFKANNRNIRLLQRHLERQARSEK